jgi:hypothetical protein
VGIVRGHSPRPHEALRENGVRIQSRPLLRTAPGPACPPNSLGAITARLSVELLPRIHPGVRTAKWGHPTYGWLSADPARCEPSSDWPSALLRNMLLPCFWVSSQRHLAPLCDRDATKIQQIHSWPSVKQTSPMAATFESSASCTCPTLTD